MGPSFQLLILNLIILFFQNLISTVLYINTAPCSKYIIGSSAETHSCGPPVTYDASNFNIVSPYSYKQLAISFTYTPTSICGGGSSNTFFQVSIQPPNGGPRKTIMSVTYYVGPNTLQVTTEMTTGGKTFYTTIVPGFVNNPIAFYMAVDLTNTGPSARAAFVADILYISPIETALSYDPSWVFDSYTKITICGGEDGSLQAACIVQNLKVSFKIPIQWITMLFSNKPNLIADYKINEGSGNSLENSQTSPQSLGSAALSSSPAPVWTTDSGLEFNFSPNQHIIIPGFIPTVDDAVVTLSLGFGFYLKLKEAPPNNGPLLSYWCSSFTPAKEMFNLIVTPGRNLKYQIDGASITTPEAIPLDQWTSIYVFYAFTKRGYKISMIYINGIMTNSAITIGTPSSPSAFSLSDTIQVGAGFKGQLKRLQVYSPAAAGFNLASTNKACNPDTCLAEMGFSNPPTCMQTICTTPGVYSSFGTCEPCPRGCSKCTNPGNCDGCKPGFYPLGSTCPPCAKHCSLCTDFETCLSCDSGYGRYNHQCVICPAGTYLHDDQSCQKLKQAIQETLKTSQLLNSALTQAANVISQGSAVSLSAAVSGRIFSQIKYLNISYSGELQVALLTWLPGFVSLGLTPNMPGSVEEKIPQRPVPYVFGKYDVPASFLINFWENLGVVLFSVVLWLLFRAIEHFVSPKVNSRAAPIIRKARTMTQSFLITALYGVYGDLVMFSIVEYRTFTIGWNLSLLSFLLSMILLIAMFLSFLYQIKLLSTYQKLKKQDPNHLQQLDQFIKRHEGCQAYWKDFKDYSLAPQLFLFFLSGRDLIFSLILATMFEYPLVQTIIITLLDCLMLVYLFIKKPFISKFDFVQQLFFEFIALIVNLNVGINAVLDAGKYEAIATRHNIGKLIIVCNMLFNFVTAGFMLICIVQALIQFYQNIKRKRVKNFEILRRNIKTPRNNAIQNTDSEQSSVPENNNNTSQNLSFQHETSELQFLSNHRSAPQKTPNGEVRYDSTQVVQGSQQIRRNIRIRRSNNVTRVGRHRLNHHNSPSQSYSEN